MSISTPAAHYLCAKILLLYIAISPFYSNANETITITNGEWPPYLSQSIDHNGYVSHIVSDAFKLKSINVKYLFRPWKRAITEAKNGAANGSIVWSVTEDRIKDFLFSDPVIIGKSVLFHLKEKPISWNSFEDLAQYKIGGTLGYEYRFEHAKKVTIERVASDSVNFRKLLSGRIDIFPSDKEAGYLILNKQFSVDDITKITYHPVAYDETSYSLMLSKKHPDSVRLLKVFNEGLQALRASGKYQQIIAAQQSGKYRSHVVTRHR
ncbi:substrate-binding periplasmic protein [Alkalimarinus coralli]|uniref:substrate-binding periplasmic protein n=1 Tax=Alkalimarinus coralli TaxID=2935863 RepID=UPI00202B9062|nr:transporter substrate-binding domain-containing protein [Alkalimarinus coralli]